MYTYTHTHTHTHTHTDLNFANFRKDRKIKYTKFNTQKFMFFDENIRTKKTSGEIKRNKLKIFALSKKKTENARRGSSFLIVSCFQPATLLKKKLFHRIISKF